MNTIIPYDRHLKQLARVLRKNSTPAELELWEAIRKKELGVEFHRQVPLLHYIVDFYCHEIGLAIEVDGKIHEMQVIEDGMRQGKLEKYGVHFLRFTNDEVLDESNTVLNKIKDKIIESTS
jgi:very-short-patch-repair endonuclease